MEALSLCPAPHPDSFFPALGFKVPPVLPVAENRLLFRRKAAVHAGPHSAEGQFLVDGAPEEQHGLRVHDHRGRRAGRIPAGEERHPRWAGCSRREDGYR